MKVVDYIKDKAIYFGKFHISEEYNTNIRFYRSENIRRKDIIEMGDVVYFMFVDNILMKIGKAGGILGFEGRCGTYNRGILGDATNNAIISIMRSLDKDYIEVYAIATPKASITIQCPLTGDVIVQEISTNKNIEYRLTHMYLSESPENELPFCTQLS